MLDDLTGKQRSGAFLFVCRVAKCASMETPEFAPRQRILTDWVWGREGIRAKSDKVVLYEVMPQRDRARTKALRTLHAIEMVTKDFELHQSRRYTDGYRLTLPWSIN